MACRPSSFTSPLLLHARVSCPISNHAKLSWASFSFLDCPLTPTYQLSCASSPTSPNPCDKLLLFLFQDSIQELLFCKAMPNHPKERWSLSSVLPSHLEHNNFNAFITLLLQLFLICLFSALDCEPLDNRFCLPIFVPRILHEMLTKISTLQMSLISLKGGVFPSPHNPQVADFLVSWKRKMEANGIKNTVPRCYTVS